MKRPAFQFYPADWRKDPALSSCSLAARGLWIELMCIAHESDRYGYLSVNGRPMDAKQIARMVGESPAVLPKLLAELEDAAVFSRDEAGTIYSRRMVKDEHIRDVRASAGKKGGNPNLLGDLVKQNDKQKPTPSSSSSSSSSKQEEPDGSLSPPGDQRPHSEILAAYHEALPACQRVEVLNDKRRKRIAAIVKLAKRVCAEQGWAYDPAEFWRAYFTECATDPWMRGEVPNPRNPAWKQNLDVLLAEDRFAGVMDRAIASMRGEA